MVQYALRTFFSFSQCMYVFKSRAVWTNTNFPAELSNTAVKNINLHNCLGVSHKNQFGLALCRAWGFRKEKYFLTWEKWNYKNVLLNTWTKTYMYSNPIQSQLVRYARICMSKVDFINSLRGLSLRLRQQGFETNRLQNSFNKFINPHGLIIEKYGAALREMRLAIQA